MRPGRDEAWREGQALRLTQSGVDHFAPVTAEDALAGDLTDVFVDPTWWANCHDPSLTPMAPGDRTPLVLGVDAAYRYDCFAVVAVSRHPARHSEVAVRLVKVWDPAVRGGIVDLDECERFIRQLCRDFNVVHVCYDPYQLAQMMQGIMADRVAWTDPFEQQTARLKADWDLRDSIINRRIWHGNDPLLNEHVTQAGMKASHEERAIRIVKLTANRKVDAAVALSMAASRCRWLTL
jgi:hypothetical protein